MSWSYFHSHSRSSCSLFLSLSALVQLYMADADETIGGGFHLQTRDTDGGEGATAERAGGTEGERDRGRDEGQISSAWSAGVEREREGFKVLEEAHEGGGLPGCISPYRIMT